MDELTLRRLNEFLDDRTRAQAELVVVWGERYFDAWDWTQRARWVFSQQYGYPYALVDSVLGQGRALCRDQELVDRWMNTLAMYGDIDHYVLSQAQQTPEQIDKAIALYWSQAV